MDYVAAAVCAEYCQKGRSQRWNRQLFPGRACLRSCVCVSRVLLSLSQPFAVSFSVKSLGLVRSCYPRFENSTEVRQSIDAPNGRFWFTGLLQSSSRGVAIAIPSATTSIVCTFESLVNIAHARRLVWSGRVLYNPLIIPTSSCGGV